MKRKIFFFIILIFASAESYGQWESLTRFKFDSVVINYFNPCLFLDDNIVVNRDSISFYQEVDIKNRAYDLIYKIKQRESIIGYFSLLDVILKTDPVYNETKDEQITPECNVWMTFNYFIGDDIVKKTYSFDNSDTLFPFAFTMLYYGIMPIIHQKQKPLKE